MSEDNALWNFVLKIYSDRQVASTCLQLQDNFGLNINRILFALWLAESGRKLVPEALDDLALCQWTEQVTEPLRRYRYEVRTSYPQPREALVDDFYQQLKNAELAAEKSELALLFKRAALCPKSLQASVLLRQHNLQQYLYFYGAEVTPELQKLCDMLIGRLQDLGRIDECSGN